MQVQDIRKPIGAFRHAQEIIQEIPEVQIVERLGQRAAKGLESLTSEASRS